MSAARFRLAENPIHLGLGARAVPQPAFTGMAWYEAYIARHSSDGAEGRLVSFHRFDAPWTSWEIHPEGEEVVIVLEGSLTLIQELADGSEQRIALAAGDYAINPRGVWHTADTGPDGAAALFITAGLGTLTRAR